MTLPAVYRPEQVAQHLGWSERRVRSEAKRLGACLVMGNRMTITEADVQALKDGTPVVLTEAQEKLLPPRKESFVYFVAVRGYIKIGWSQSWRGRIANMQTSNPEPIEVLLVLGRPKLFEKTMHQKFDVHRTSGEWFRDHPDIRAYIEGREGECWYRWGQRR